jgi:LysR family hydrogen peroxide-inducible transcriptional activator
MPYMPTLKQLQYLIALADYKTFSRAAQNCNITQPTLSAGIAALENLLGQELVDRSHNKYAVLTPMGHEVLDRARKVIEDAEAIVDRAKYVSEPLSGPLRLGIIPTIAPYILPQCLPSLSRIYPKLELQIHEDLSHRLVESLNSGNLDLLLMAFPFEIPGADTETLFHEPFVLACPKGGWKKNTPIKLDDLEDENLLLLEDGHCLRDHALAACKLHPPSNKKTFSATSLATLVQMVQHGYGITLLPKMAVTSEALPDNIQILNFKAPLPTREVGIAWRKGNQRADSFIEFGNLIEELVRS